MSAADVLGQRKVTIPSIALVLAGNVPIKATKVELTGIDWGRARVPLLWQQAPAWADALAERATKLATVSTPEPGAASDDRVGSPESAEAAAP